MSIKEERPRNARARRQPAGVTGDVIQPGKDWAEKVHGFPLLPDEQPVTTVRDSLYDLIPLGPREEKLISAPAFLRLQQVKQLGFVYRIWPGATHTRYEHSLGCYHLAVRALRGLLDGGQVGCLGGFSVS